MIVVVEFFVETVLFSLVEIVKDVSTIFFVLIGIIVVLITLVVSPIETVVALESIVISSGHFSSIETKSDEQKQAKCYLSLVGRGAGDFSEHIAVRVPQIHVR